MSKNTWDLIKLSKDFFVRTYRKTETIALASVVLNLILLVGIVYCYANIPEPDYYATFGGSAPVPLIAMDAPNYSSQALIADSNEMPSAEKAIPQ